MHRIEKLKSALKKEFEESKNRYSNSRGLENIKEKVSEGSALYPLILQKHNFSVKENPILILSKEVNQETPFKKGDPLQLISNEEKVTGTLTEIKQDSIEFTLNTEEIEDWVFENDHFALIPTVDDRTFREMEKALDGLSQKNNAKLQKLYRVIFEGQRQEFERSNIPYENKDLNDSQQRAVSFILTTETVSLVHGPPGTGKTTTLVAAVKELVSRNQKVLVVAPSNAAVDYFHSKLGELNTLRIGRINNTLDQKILESKDYKLIKKLKKQAQESREKASKWKRSFSAEDRQERKRLYKEAREIRKEILEIQKHIENKFINEADVICTTLIGSANGSIEKTHFDYVFIDEAGQSLEPACWVAAQKGDRLILCGDHQQLPPTILNQEAKPELEKSLLESASETLEHISFLDTQYRMREEIAGYSNHYFYQNRLKTKVENLEQEFFQKPIEFIDTAGTGYDEEKMENGPGLFNSGELELLKKRIENSPEIKPTNTVIISPYRKQVESIQKEIPLFEVNTIDSFQGQESQIVLISLVRSNENSEIGFLKDYRRMNVAMTRAKQKLIIIGDSATIGNDQFYAPMISYFEEKEAYRSAFELMY